jgi:uncharacterized protein
LKGDRFGDRVCGVNSVDARVVEDERRRRGCTLREGENSDERNESGFHSCGDYRIGRSDGRPKHHESAHNSLHVVTDGRDGALVSVKVIARASKSAVAGIRDGAILVRLSAPPVDGAANAELLDVIAGALGVPKRAITIVSGSTSRRKTLHVAGMRAADVIIKLSLDRE